MADNTFLGLQPYTEDDAYRFKGRAEESQELFRLILRNDFTVCYAESGEGKTSLLNAGVFPLLRENMCFPISITFTRDDYMVTPDSFDTIIDRCIKDSITEYNKKNKGVNIEYKLCSTDFQGLDSQVELQRKLSKYSWWKQRNYRPQAMGLTFTPVFFFDQFEEVFNMPGSNVWTKKFFDWLEVVSSDSCPDMIVEKVRGIIGDKATFPIIKEEKDFKAVFSLRKEFIGDLDYWGMQTHFIPALKDNRYCLKALTYEGAKKVMSQQERFDEDKVEEVLTYFVGQYSREPEKTIEENLPVIPALLLSVVCLSWEKDINYFAGADKSGIKQSLDKILERFYNETISNIVTSITMQYRNTVAEEDEGFQAIVTRITKKDRSTIAYNIRKEIETAMSALVDANGKRIRTKTTSAALTQIDFDEKYKKALCDGHIIRIIKIDGEDYVEVVHDSLCKVIKKQKVENITEISKEILNALNVTLRELNEKDPRMDLSKGIDAVQEQIIESNAFALEKLKEIAPYLMETDRDKLMTRLKDIEERRGELQVKLASNLDFSNDDVEIVKNLIKDEIKLKHEFKDVLSKEIEMLVDSLNNRNRYGKI